eukprot:Lithocolla_globosa_v1_NODE_2574_length_1948_cov_71.245642.p1 type:complete len:302 gc:universal NODE_2574_length_1948_cov_71.245642:1055-150(-)
MAKTEGKSYQSEIQQMMYTFGDVRNTNSQAAELIEDIVRHNIILLAIEACNNAQKRRSRYMHVEDVIFLIRHDVPKVNRIMDFLSWKDVRKSEPKTGGGGGDDDAVVEEEEKHQQPKRKKVKLSFDYVQSLTNFMKDDEFEEDDSSDLLHLQEITNRLKEADDVTRVMSREEYIEYAECRQASFTYKKNKRFREWLNLAVYIDIKPNDEILEILGYIAWEMVCRLTRTALMVKNELENLSSDELAGESEARRQIGSLFATPDEKTPILTHHIREGYRRMQASFQFFHVFQGGNVKNKVKFF